MRKFSRRHGWMSLATWASGDGSVSFSWGTNAYEGKHVPETVTESDVSEFMRDPLNENRWKGWEVVMLGGASGIPSPRLAKPAKRPHHTSRKLVMGGVEYEYGVTESFRADKGMAHNGRNTTFFRDGA